jgi:putative Holliday junction resolvase
VTLALGFDYGEKRIGVAIGNRTTGTSRALECVPCPAHEEAWAPLDRTISTWQPDQLLVGIPLTMEGEKQAMTRKARRFVHALRARYQLPVTEVDERLSSIAADEELVQARSMGGKTRRLKRGDTDSMAAAILVQQWLDAS